ELKLEDGLLRLLRHERRDVGGELVQRRDVLAQRAALDRLAHRPGQRLYDHRLAVLEVVRGEAVRDAGLRGDRAERDAVEAVSGDEPRERLAERIATLSARDRAGRRCRRAGHGASLPSGVT